MLLSNNCNNSFIQANPTSFNLKSNCLLPKRNQHIQTFNMMYLDKVICSNYVKEIKVYKKLSSNSSKFVIRKHIKIFLLYQKYNLQASLSSRFKLKYLCQLSLSSTILDPSLDKVEVSSSSSSSTKQNILPLRCYLYYER